jgi:hypothetical protein
MEERKYEIYACLPFIQLKTEEIIALGPVRFWPAQLADACISADLRDSLETYLENVSHVGVQVGDQFIETGVLPHRQVTCVSLDKGVAPELRESLLIDSIYLLFFCSAFSHLFDAGTIPSIELFTKYLPASPAFLQNKDLWGPLHIVEAQRKCPVVLPELDQEMCRGLGHALACSYELDTCTSAAETSQIQSLIRAVRYFVDRFFGRFENLLTNGQSVSPFSFEPEDIVLLVTSFEALFHLKEEIPHIDLKHKLRPMLGLRYSTAVELVWSFVEGFFHLRDQVVHGQALPDIYFRANKSYAISYFYLGIKLFLYGVYWRLHSCKLITSLDGDTAWRPLHFQWVSAEEILAFFWPEEELLERLIKLSERLAMQPNAPDLTHDQDLLERIFIHTVDTYSAGKEVEGVIWTPLAHERFLELAEKLLKISPSTLSPEFLDRLRRRMTQ